MARKVLLAALALMAISMQAKVSVEVSETVELLSALSRTAGYPEYNMDLGGQYTEDIDKWFAPFKDHPIIKIYQGLYSEYGIAYNAPMDLAVNLVIDGGRLKFIGDKSCMDSRWTHVDIDGLVAQLNQFYRDTRFHEFFEQHQGFYQDALRQYETNVMQYFHQDWYPRFYGTEPGEAFHIIIGFSNGGNNYGASRQFPGQAKENFSICGYWFYPQMGSVLDPENAKKYSAPTLIHEFNHSFVNPLQEVEKNAKALGDIPNKLLNQSLYIMQQQAYGEGKTVLDESVVRAATIIYMMEHGYSSQDVRDALNEELSCGFAWMPELLTAMRDYNTHRNKYPTLSDFYPQIAKVLNNYLDQQQKRLEKPLSLVKSLKRPDTSTASFSAVGMETAELMGILSRIAGYEEYNEDFSIPYFKDIDQWFSPFNQHPAIEYFQRLRDQYHIAYDAPMSLAMRLNVENGKIVKLQEEAGGCGLDSRWDNVNMQEFLGLLNQFYSDSRFHEFFLQHQSFYNGHLKEFNDKVMPYVHPEWFNDFLGCDNDTRHNIVIAFANGSSYYGASRHLKGQPWDQYDVINYVNFSQEGAYNNSIGIAGQLINMFNRFSPQPLVNSEGMTGDICEVADRLYDMNLTQMRMSQVPDGKSAIAKSITAAAGFIYMNMMDNEGGTKQNTQNLSDYSTVFTWMPELVTALGDYANNRNKYKTISDFYPQLAKLINKNIQAERQRIDNALK